MSLYEKSIDENKLVKVEAIFAFLSAIFLSFILFLCENLKVCIYKYRVFFIFVFFPLTLVVGAAGLGREEIFFINNP